MYQALMNYLKEKPPLYAASTAPFWDDVHISKCMLRAHLDADLEAASRKSDFMDASVSWICETSYKPGQNELLDLGCGPGLYAERFARAGFLVTGIDFSSRSIAYAKESAEKNHLFIRYLYQNYLDIEYENAFDVVTLIYCDFGVLSSADRHTLLQKVKKAIKPGGMLFIDGYGAKQWNHFSEGRTTTYHEKGFWSENPHLCIQSNYRYPASANFLEQYVIVQKDTCDCFNIWNQVFSPESLGNELRHAGFASVDFYDDAAGKAYTGEANTLCAVAR